MNDDFTQTSGDSTRHPKGLRQNKWGWLKRIFISRSDEGDLTQDKEAEIKDIGQESTQDLLVNLNNLKTLRLDDISVPKADIIALSDEASFEEVFDVFRTCLL